MPAHTCDQWFGHILAVPVALIVSIIEENASGPGDVQPSTRRLRESIIPWLKPLIEIVTESDQNNIWYSSYTEYRVIICCYGKTTIRRVECDVHHSSCCPSISIYPTEYSVSEYPYSGFSSTTTWSSLP